MGVYVNPPADGFAEILNYKKYIDKSGMIAYMNSVLGTPDKLICFSRPRRFGKSFAAKMITAYYSKGADARTLFEKLKVANMDIDSQTKEHSAFENHLNKYDVISVDMTPFVSLAENAGEIVHDLQQEVIEELDEEFPDCLKKGTKTLYKALLQINRKTGRKFFIVIDEWDMIFREAKDNILVQKEYINLLRSLFKSNQTSQMIIGAYITGILPIKKYGTQSALTDFREYTMLKPGPLAEFVGFTENEVRKLCMEYHLDFDETRKWYDGYRFDQIGHIYCPNSIIELILTQEFDSYWTATETYESLRDYIDLNMDGLKDAIVDLLGGKRHKIDVGTFQNDMTSLASKDDIFTLLVHLGYLAYDFAGKEVFIPNEEVRREFIRAVKEGRRLELAKAVKMSDTIDDIYALPDGQRAELIDGQIYYMAPPGWKHQKLLNFINTEINLYIRNHNGNCEVVPAPFAVFLNKDDINYLEPDISVICDTSKLDEKGCHGAPDWVIEIVSPASRSRDYLSKLIKYRSAGVDEYWIVDPETKIITVYAFKQDIVDQYSFGKDVPVGIFKDFSIRVE